MTYYFDGMAQDEASGHPAPEDRIEQLRELCRAKASLLGTAGVRGHTINFVAAAWAKIVSLPASVPRVGRISRGDVLDIGSRVRQGTSPATELLVTSFVWGWGTTGFGPSRLRGILDDAGEKLEPSLQRVLAAALGETGAPDPIAGYAYLYGGYMSNGSDQRAAPNAQEWARLRRYGPAFFTKLLYFAVPGSLILDNRLANVVYDLSGLPRLVNSVGRSWPWTPYRYAVYLHWMRQTAAAVSVEPELLELTMFQAPGNVADEHDAAD